MYILTTPELISYIKKQKMTRQIKQLHIHHTWRPNHSNYNGENGLQLQQNMKNYHINNRKFSDIAQHLTLLPDGKWVTGRDFNKNPASIKSWNDGAFAIEMLGNFDIGYDQLKGSQLKSIIEFSAFFISHFNLILQDIKFHRENASWKTCPGSGINKDWFINLVEKEANNMLNVNFLGKEINLQDYMVKDNKNYVQIRELFEKIGFDVIWDNENKTIKIKLK